MKIKCPSTARAAGRQKWSGHSRCGRESLPSHAFMQQLFDCEGQFDAGLSGPAVLIALGLAQDDADEIPFENSDPALDEALRKIAADEFLLAMGMKPPERADSQDGMAPEAGPDEESPE